MTRTAPRRRLRPRRTAAALVAAVLVTTALAGCSPDQVGSAAVIDGEVVSTDELQSATQSYLAVVKDADSGEVQRTILQRRIVSAVIDEAAREAGVSVSAGKIARDRDEALESVGGRKALVRALAQQQQAQVVPPDEIERWVEDRLLFSAMAEEVAGGSVADQSPEAQQALQQVNADLVEVAQRLDVEVSPRYGTWDPERGLTPLVSGGLSSTAEQLNGGRDGS
jgi:hypothetical protein